MVRIGSKSALKTILDLLRNVLILGATGYAEVKIWQWNWIVAILAALPVYIIMLNLFGFLTLPLYLITPEARRVRETHRDVMKELSGS